MDSESKIQNLIENFTKLELSQANISQEMLSNLINLMRDANISSIPFDQMLLELNRMHLGNIQNTNIDNEIDTSIDSSISSTFSNRSQDSKSSPPLSFKFKTPKKATFSKNIKKISTGKKSSSPKIKIDFNPISHSSQDSLYNTNFKNEQSHCFLGPFSDPNFPPSSTPQTPEIEISSPSSLPNLCEFGSSNFTRDLIPESTTTTKTHLSSFFNLDQQNDGNNHPPIYDDEVIAEASYANTNSVSPSSTKVDILSHNEQAFDQNYNNANRMNIVNDDSNKSNINITKNSNNYGFAVCLEDENNNRRRQLSKTKSIRSKQKPLSSFSKTLPTNLPSTTSASISSAQTSTENRNDNNNLPSNPYDATRTPVTSLFKDNSLFTNDLSSTLLTYPNNNSSSPVITPEFTYSLPKTVFTNTSSTIYSTSVSSDSMSSPTTFRSTGNNSASSNMTATVSEVEKSMKNISIGSNDQIPQHSTVPITAKSVEFRKDSPVAANDSSDRSTSPVMTSPMNVDSNLSTEDNDTTTTSQSQRQSGGGLQVDSGADSSEFRPWYPTVVPGKLNNSFSSSVVMEPTIVSSHASKAIPIFTANSNYHTTTTTSTLFSGFQQQFVPPPPPPPPQIPALATSLFQSSTASTGTTKNDDGIDESRSYGSNAAPATTATTTGRDETDNNSATEFKDDQSGGGGGDDGATINHTHDYLSKSATFSFKANIDANSASSSSSSHYNTLGAKKKSKLKLMSRIKKKPSGSGNQHSGHAQGYVDGLDSNDRFSSESDPMMTSPSAAATADDNNGNKIDPVTSSSTSFSTPDRTTGSNSYGFQYGDNIDPFMRQSIPTFDFSTTSVRSNEKRPLADSGADTWNRQSSNDKSAATATSSSSTASRGKSASAAAGGGGRGSSRSSNNTNNPQSPTGRLAAEAALSRDSAEESEAAMKARLCQLADLLRKQGKELYANEAYERALDAFTKALKTAPATWPPRPAVLGNRAATFMMMERYVEAALDCESAIAEDPSFFRLHARMGRALLRLGDLFGSQNAFNAVLDTIASRSKTSRSTLERLSEQETADYAADEASTDDANAGLNQVKKARNLMSEIPDLLKQQPQKDCKLALKKSEELLQLCPQMRAAQTLKAKALSQCQYWTDTKLYIERVSLLVHESIQSRNVHSAAQLPSPKPEDLVWTEIGAGMVRINLAAIVQALLFMGPDMALCYIKALKNNDAARYCCGDVMDNIISILLSVASHVGSTPSWSWVNEEEAKTRAMVEAKSLADKHFRLKAFQLAHDYYSEALKCDADAHRLNAVLFANRAAASMNMKNYNDAISDCHYAIIRDPVYIKAFLRRARAYRALGNVAASARDYKRYLMSLPPPSDLQEVQGELDAMEQSQFLRAARDASRLRAESARSAWAEFSSEFSSQRGASGSGSGDGEEDSGASARPTSSKSYTADPDYMKFTGSKPYGRSTSTDDANSDNRSPSGGASSANPSGSANTNSSSSRRKAGTNPTKTRTSSASWEWAREAREEDSRQQVPPYGKPRDNRSRTTGGSSGSHHHSSHSTGGNNNRYGSGNRDPNIDPFTVADPDLYAVLGVSEHVSDRDLKVAYRRLALRYHPDKNKDAGAEDKFKILTSAYSTLSDKSTRRTYDLTRTYGGRF